MYKIVLSSRAQEDVAKLKITSPTAMKKLTALLKELREHPRSGTGKAERLKHYATEVWSRRITKEHRLVYTIKDCVVEVLVLSAYGHYK